MIEEIEREVFAKLRDDFRKEHGYEPHTETLLKVARVQARAILKALVLEKVNQKKSFDLYQKIVDKGL